MNENQRHSGGDNSRIQLTQARGKQRNVLITTIGFAGKRATRKAIEYALIQTEQIGTRPMEA